MLKRWMESKDVYVSLILRHGGGLKAIAASWRRFGRKWQADLGGVAGRYGHEG